MDKAAALVRNGVLLATLALLTPTATFAAPVLSLKCHWDAADRALARRPLIPQAKEIAEMFDQFDPLFLEVDLPAGLTKLIHDSSGYHFWFGVGAASLEDISLIISFTNPKIPSLQAIPHKISIRIDRFDLSASLTLLLSQKGIVSIDNSAFTAHFIRTGKCVKQSF